jgi:hypothetical protein
LQHPACACFDPLTLCCLDGLTANPVGESAFDDAMESAAMAFAAVDRARNELNGQEDGKDRVGNQSCWQTVFVGEPVSTGTVRSNNIPLVHLLFFICLTLSFLETFPRLAFMADRV